VGGGVEGTDAGDVITITIRVPGGDAALLLAMQIVESLSRSFDGTVLSTDLTAAHTDEFIITVPVESVAHAVQEQFPVDWAS
jgi:hypothetical protein